MPRKRPLPIRAVAYARLLIREAPRTKGWRFRVLRRFIRAVIETLAPLLPGYGRPPAQRALPIRAAAYAHKLVHEAPRTKGWRRRVLRRFIRAVVETFAPLVPGFGRPPRAAPGHWPRITLVTPVFNGAPCIAGAIESVLAQGYPNLEYFVVDDGSTDDTLGVVLPYRDQLTGIASQPNRGMYDALHKGFSLGTGEILAYLKCEDRLEPGGLLRVGAYFREHPEVKVIYHHSVTLDAAGWRYPSDAQLPVNFARILLGHIVFQEGVFYRRRVYEAVGGFATSVKIAGDWDLWVRMARKFRLVLRPGRPSCVTLRDGQLNAKTRAYWEEVRARQLTILSTLNLHERAQIWWERSTHAVRRYIDSWRRPGRFSYPIDWSEFPPPEIRMPAEMRTPRCPVNESPAERLLFTARGQYVYYFGQLHAAGCSQPPGEILPAPNCGSPYRGFRGYSSQVKFARKIHAPRFPIPPRPRWPDDSGIDPMSAPYDFPPTQAFQQIVLDRRLENLEDPEAALRRLASVLAPRGRLIIVTPNLNSAQIDMFGPTWANWGRGYTFSVRSLKLLARSCGFKLRSARTVSREDWTTSSLLLNARGLGVEAETSMVSRKPLADARSSEALILSRDREGAVAESHAEPGSHAESIVRWSRWLWDWRGRGDVIIATLERNS